MLLTIDIGNTTVAVGGFQGPELRFVRRLPSDRNMDAAVCAARIRTLLAEEGAAPQDVEGAVLSSVVPSLTQVAVQAAEALTRRPVRVLGRDLIVAANGVPEAIVAAILVPAVCIPMGKALKLNRAPLAAREPV